MIAGDRARSGDVPWGAFFRGIRRLLRHGREMIGGEGARGLGVGLEEDGDAIAGQLLIPQAKARCSGALLRNTEAVAPFAWEIGLRQGSCWDGCWRWS